MTAETFKWTITLFSATSVHPFCSKWLTIIFVSVKLGTMTLMEMEFAWKHVEMAWFSNMNVTMGTPTQMMAAARHVSKKQDSLVTRISRLTVRAKCLFHTKSLRSWRSKLTTKPESLWSWWTIWKACLTTSRNQFSNLPHRMFDCFWDCQIPLFKKWRSQTWLYWIWLNWKTWL